MATRADRIEKILQEHGGRSTVSLILNDLALVEGVDLDTLRYNASASATVRQDNAERVKRGQAKRFRVFERDGGGDEERGYISLVASATSPEAGKTDGEKISDQVVLANSIVREALKEHIKGLTWQEFESIFLSRLLATLGF